MNGKGNGREKEGSRKQKKERMQERKRKRKNFNNYTNIIFTIRGKLFSKNIRKIEFLFLIK